MGYDSVLIVVGDIGVGIEGLTAEAVTKVHTESIDFVFIEPVIEGAGKHLTRLREIMIPVLIDIIAVRRIGIEPGVPLEVFAIRIEHILRIKTCSVIEDHIDDYRHAATVKRVHELFEALRRTVGLIDSEIVVGRIAPVIVAVKLAQRHKFNRINA